MQGPFNETPLGVGPCPCEACPYKACEACSREVYGMQGLFIETPLGLRCKQCVHPLGLTGVRRVDERALFGSTHCLQRKECLPVVRPVRPARCEACTACPL
jgi:hypothetical protein